MVFSKLNDDRFWTNVRKSDDYEFLRDDLKALYAENFAGTLPILRYSDYCIFFKTGSRKEYEEGYFLRRRRLNILAILCKIYPENAELFSELENTIWAILDEYSWALPAHMPDMDTYVPEFIDLFAAETGYTLSEIKSMFYKRFSPLMLSRITFELDRRIIKSFCTNQYWWESVQNNWAAVCAGSVGITFMYERPMLFYAVKPRLDAAIHAFLSSYKADGVCREGLSYWNYGFGYFCFYAAHLQAFSKGAFDMLSDPFVKTIALFQQQMFLKRNVTVSFADGSDTGSFNLGLTHFLKLAFGKEFRIPPKKYYHILDTCGRWGGFSFSFLFYDKSFKGDEVPGECLFSNSSWFIKRQKAFAFAAKGGNNDEPHNHNDLGAFIIADKNGQLICDLGCGEYTRQYFEPETRYTILCNSSLGHAVPIVGGEAQQCGADSFASLVKTGDGISINLTHAYKTNGIRNITRDFRFSENAIALCDIFDFYNPTTVTERFVSRIKPEICTGAVTIGGMRILACDYTPKITEQHHYEHGTGRKTPVYLIDYELECKNHGLFTLIFSFDE